jgi:sugar lactone lactonase YvrE
MSSIVCVVRAEDILGEGPVWDERAGRLWWVDIKGGQLLWLDPASGETGGRIVEAR